VKKHILLGVIGVFFLSSGCFGLFGKKVGGDDKSIKKTQIAGVLAETKVEAKADVKATAKVNAKAEVKADVKATGADLSKRTSISGGQHIEGVDMKTLAYIIGSFMALLTTIMTAVITDQKILIGRMIKRAEKKDIQFLDIANDAKEILLKILPQVDATIHRAYENGLKALEEKKSKK